jgi:CubicO group peptidase (beta-lactamase class C family)
MSLTLVLSFILTAMPCVGYAQVGSQAVAPATNSYEKALAAIEAKVDARRQELGIPGMSLVIVKDDQVIFAKGLGYKDFENRVPVTADTQFAIGSATKAFTALTVLMSQDEGKLSLDASPKTVLPYFKMYDAETDKNMTIRDLLTHSSGLNRTDLAMITGKLTRQELIRVAGEAKPIGKLRERFGYQNLMFAAAGEVVATVQKQPWEKFVPERIFKPLGMTNSNMAIREMAKAKDHSLGYIYNFDTKETRRLPFRDIDEVAPAGSINSSANDMAKWLRFILSGGNAGGKRLVSEASFAEWLKPQMKMNNAGTAHYALGWMIQKWNNETVVHHGGNIDGFNALVATIPDKKLGFVMLTNVSGSPLGNELMPLVWENILGKPEVKAANVAVTPDKEAGIYRLQEASLDIDVEWKDGKLVATVPGQPTYTLENVTGRRYKLVGAPEGFFMTFKDKELYLEQPQGNYTLPRTGGPKPPSFENAKPLIGKYLRETNGPNVEVKELDGKVVLSIEGQQPYPLIETEKDRFWLSPLPDTFYLSVHRGPDGKVQKISTSQPGVTTNFVPAGSVKLPITTDELLAKALEAIGGEAAWRKITSRVMTTTMDFEQQGVKAVQTSWAKAPNRTATESKMLALGKEIATGWEYFDGTTAEEIMSFSPAQKATGKRLEDVRLASDLHGMLDLRSKYKTIEVIRVAKCGEEECYAVEFGPEKGTKFVEHYSTKTFLLLRREGVISSSSGGPNIPYSVRYDDYRLVDGVRIPFRTVSNNAGSGDTVTLITSVKHNVAIDDKIFAPRKLKP